MKTCPNCKRGVEDDSVYCGYCDAKLPYIPEAENSGQESGAAVNAAGAPPAGWSCENCGEQLEPSFDTCWKCGAVRAKPAEVPDAAGGAAAALLTVWGRDKRLEVLPDKVLVLPSVAQGEAGQAAYVPPCEIHIKNIVSIEFTNAKGSVTGGMTVNYTAAPPDDSMDAVHLSESVLFDAAANQEMAKALELIKQRSAVIDARAADGPAT